MPKHYIICCLSNKDYLRTYIVAYLLHLLTFYARVSTVMLNMFLLLQFLLTI